MQLVLQLSPDPPLDLPADVELEESDQQQVDHSVVEKDGSEEADTLARRLPDGPPNPGKLTDVFEAVGANLATHHLGEIERDSVSWGRL